MYFVLNKVIKFTPATNELCLALDVANCILISNAASRLLAELIKNANEISLRDEILQKVWEEYGYTSSHNSLYMAVSEIRKSFSALGYSKEMLITVPKVGIKLVANIDIFELAKSRDYTTTAVASFPVAESHASVSECQPDNLTEPLNDQRQVLPDLLHEDVANEDKSCFRWFILCSILLVGLGLLFVQHHNKFKINKLDQYDFFQFQSCRVYIINTSVGYNINVLKEKAIKTINNNHIDCNGPSKSIYFQDNFVRSGMLSEHTLGVCSRSSGKNRCETIKSLAG
ncbi:winged helix-turn-helix domain-containing protein [Rahnella aceris]|uniref:winged helix-turn-helix domain-containing protein n=1 Tax=Rahnella sp. (strain Y9602) TaxID=2703885 RepID=UPI003647DDD9